MTDNTNIFDWRSTLLPTGATIQQAVQSLETSCLQIVLVVQEDDKLVGTLTDGDIRRAFLKGFSLDDAIDEIMHTNPMVVPPEISRSAVLKMMQINKFSQVPTIDEAGRVVGLHVWDEIIKPKQINTAMVIMAGGKGTRLRPHTENCPKPMLEVSGKPMLQHIIERARDNGISNFFISLNYLGEMIEAYFGDGSAFGVEIVYLREDAPLGTAGSLSLIENRPDSPLIVTNGDVITDVQYSEILDYHERHKAMATMAVKQHEMQNQFGVVQTNGLEIEGFEEKPVYRSYVNAGIYVVSPEGLDCLQSGEACDMPALFQRLKEKNDRIIVYPMHEPWLDVGRPDDLQAARDQKN